MEELLTVDEVAKLFRVHPVTIRRHIKAGRLRSIRLGRRVRVYKSDVEKLPEVEREVEYCTPKLHMPIYRTHPLSPEAREKRQKAYEAILELREKIGSIGIAADELIHIAREEEESGYDL